MSIIDYGHRGVPNVFLSPPVQRDGTSNSAHFMNQEYDTLVKSYIAALDLDSQTTSAGKIQNLLLDESPVLFAYLYDFLTATKKGDRRAADRDEPLVYEPGVALGPTPIDIRFWLRLMAGSGTGRKAAP
ncbi:MAG: hypothetical protein E6R08_08820 [Nevskiaceae bacterium]|nr:MAG: hypothetical protein E6R08_08820 [Nevskiaceae bacterium]